MKTWIALAALATSLPCLAQAAKPQTTVARRSPSHADLTLVMGTPLSVEHLSSVDPHYRGMNVAAIYDILHRDLGEAKQSEYETNAQFDARVEKIKGLPLFGGHTIGDQYTFVLGGAWDGERSFSTEDGGGLSYFRGAIHTSYDAESQVLTVTIPTLSGVAFGRDHTAFGWNYNTRTTGHHVGQNAFGVKKVINEGVSLQHTLEVDLADLSWLKAYCKQEFGGDVECRVPIPAGKARAMDGDVRVAIGATLKEPYTGEEAGTEKATIDSPYETYEVQRGLFISPNQLVIYSGRTGEIVAQYSNRAFQQEYPLHVVISENKTPNWSDPVCTGYLIRDVGIRFDYQLDDGETVNIFNPNEPLRLQAKSSVTLSVPYCFIPRLTVLRDGAPQQLTCEKRPHLALDSLKCEAIGLGPATAKE